MGSTATDRRRQQALLRVTIVRCCLFSQSKHSILYWSRERVVTIRIPGSGPLRRDTANQLDWLQALGIAVSAEFERRHEAETHGRDSAQCYLLPYVPEFGGWLCELEVR